MDGLEPVKEKAKKFGQLVKWYDFTDPNGGESGQKFGTVQITGVYMTPASSYPLQEFFMRNVAVKHGQAPVIHLMPKIYEMIQKRGDRPNTDHHSYHAFRRSRCGL